MSFKVFKVIGNGDWSSGVAIVAAENIDQAVSLANEATDECWSVTYNKSDRHDPEYWKSKELLELEYKGQDPKVITIYETGV